MNENFYFVGGLSNYHMSRNDRITERFVRAFWFWWQDRNTSAHHEISMAHVDLYMQSKYGDRLP